MGDITKNLSRHEFACRCGCGSSEPHPVLVIGTQDVVDTCGCKRVTVTSGTRCEVHHGYLVNMGRAAEGSKHQIWQPSGYSLAADCIFHDVLLSSALSAARAHPAFKNGGIGLYLGQVPRLHLDVRDGKARWGVIDGEKVTLQTALSELLKREKKS